MFLTIIIHTTLYIGYVTSHHIEGNVHCTLRATHGLYILRVNLYIIYVNGVFKKILFLNMYTLNVSNQFTLTQPITTYAYYTQKHILQFHPLKPTLTQQSIL